MADPTHILLISGSLRERSTNTAVLRTASAVAPGGITAVLYDGLAHLPHFNPDDDTVPLHPTVAGLRSAIRAAGALLLSTPEYAGALPGSFKNLLDWTIGDGEAGSIYEKPVAWINAAPRGAHGAHEELRQVLGYAHATVVESACSRLPVSSDMVDAAGLIPDEVVRSRLSAALADLAGAAVNLG